MNSDTLEKLSEINMFISMAGPAWPRLGASWPRLGASWEQFISSNHFIYSIQSFVHFIYRFSLIFEFIVFFVGGGRGDRKFFSLRDPAEATRWPEAR